MGTCGNIEGVSVVQGEGGWYRAVLVGKWDCVLSSQSVGGIWIMWVVYG
jgi:hypothetical protein